MASDKSPAPEPTGQPAGNEPASGAAHPDDRIGRVESKVDRLADLVSKLIPGSGNDKPAPDGDGQPASVGEQVRAELARARTEQEQAEAAERQKSEAQQLRDDVAKLKEAPPAAPVPRRTRLLGWGDR